MRGGVVFETFAPNHSWGLRGYKRFVPLIKTKLYHESLLEGGEGGEKTINPLFARKKMSIFGLTPS